MEHFNSDPFLKNLWSVHNVEGGGYERKGSEKMRGAKKKGRRWR